MSGETAFAERKQALPVDAPPSPSGSGFPVVGTGTSAGGLAAFEAFFSGMPADVDPGMAFINGEPALFGPSAPRGQRLPMDLFFRSMALDQRERAIRIVLSGNGSDGSLDAKARLYRRKDAYPSTPETFWGQTFRPLAPAMALLQARPAGHQLPGNSPCASLLSRPSFGNSPPPPPRPASGAIYTISTEATASAIGQAEGQAMDSPLFLVVLEDAPSPERGVANAAGKGEEAGSMPGPDAGLVDVWLTAPALLDGKGGIYAIATTEREIRQGGDKP